LRQRKVARLAYDSEHGKLWQDIKADLDKTRASASKFAHDAEWAFGRRTVRVLAALMLFTVVVALLLVFLNWYIVPIKPGEKKGLVLAVAQILAGTALLSGLHFTWRGLQVNREGQITERFTRAIDQLGDDKLEVRIGGIYALAKIAEDSDVYYWPIIEILAAYVRKNAPWPTTEASESGDDSDHEEELEAGKERSHQHKRLDIQAILYILRDLRDPKHHHVNREDDFIRLTDTDLQYADLREIHLERARLRGANLKEARLGSAHLSEARLRNTKFVEANLEKATLQLADLEEAILCKAELQGANLQRADLEGALLEGALLEGALLEGADLQKADLQGAFLQGVDLQGTRELTQKQIEWAIGSNEPLFQTKLPEGLSRPQLWSKSIEEQTKIVPKNS
jgi:hypothetical protein